MATLVLAHTYLYYTNVFPNMYYYMNMAAVHVSCMYLTCTCTFMDSNTIMIQIYVYMRVESQELS